MRLILSIGLLGFAVWSVLGWAERRSAWQELAAARPSEGAEAEPRYVDRPAWLRDALGVLPEAPFAASLREGFRSWGLDPDRVPGWDLLESGPPAAAARLELARWFEVAPGREARARSVALRSSSASGAASVELVADLVGPPAAVLPWLAHLLEAPGPGYFSDPRRVRLRTEGENDVAVELQLEIWPATRFLAEDGS